ncbi:unnamed protein product [Lactuca virosa]|uniref:Transcription factor MYC/MYB N-terminal domain-containing protein n=1 Tax=Lactuca virosa TaxID=75947 RepID=A0AAU9NY85_9ASTR|nr:unnamed protein product [Lactuca virosa]
MDQMSRILIQAFFLHGMQLLILNQKLGTFHFNSGIKTIAVISVREGIIQLGSFDKILEDLNLVLTIQRKFSYLRSIPGLFHIQRPFSTVQVQQCPYNPLKHKTIGSEEAQQVIGSKVNIHTGESQHHKGPVWSLGSGYNTQREWATVLANSTPLAV